MDDSMLWFDVEERYNTTPNFPSRYRKQLWFDVEERYNTTILRQNTQNGSCGLM